MHVEAVGGAQRNPLETHFLLRSLEPTERRGILSYARNRRYANGETIFLKGSAGTGMMAVMSGQVRISAPSREGKEIVLNTIRTGEVFGEIALLDGGERTADATAQGDCELMVLERRDILPYLEKNPKVCLKLLEVLCDRLRKTTEQVEDLLFLGLPSRVAKALLRLTEDGTKAVRISQRELGALVGGTRESVNKCLGDWQRREILAIDNGAITITDVEPLELIAEGE
jgi:CRP-like cAMP-binding protein